MIAPDGYIQLVEIK